jgi:aryl-alcohol dehydrogenase-like predicted oxidoreductase
MKYRELGQTGIEVSEVGLGAWQIGRPVNGYFEEIGRVAHGWGPVDDVESLRLIRKCGEWGINFVDTAACYGAGHSEEMVGKAISEKRESWVVETKGGEWFDDELVNHKDFSYERLIQQVDESLARLKTDYIDVYLLHGPSQEDVQGGECLKALDKIRTTGKARVTGASIGSPSLGLSLLQHDVVDVLQVPINVVNAKMTDRLLDEAKARGVGIVVRNVMGSGLYTGEFDSESVFSDKDRRSWCGSVNQGLQIAEAFRFLETEGRTLTQSYIRYPLQLPGVSTVIVGSKRVEHMEDNAGAVAASDITPDEMEKITNTRKPFFAY